MAISATADAKRADPWPPQRRSEMAFRAEGRQKGAWPGATRVLTRCRHRIWNARTAQRGSAGRSAVKPRCGSCCRRGRMQGWADGPSRPLIGPPRPSHLGGDLRERWPVGVGGLGGRGDLWKAPRDLAGALNAGFWHFLAALGPRVRNPASATSSTRAKQHGQATHPPPLEPIEWPLSPVALPPAAAHPPAIPAAASPTSVLSSQLPIPRSSHRAALVALAPPWPRPTPIESPRRSPASPHRDPEWPRSSLRPRRAAAAAAAAPAAPAPPTSGRAARALLAASVAPNPAAIRSTREPSTSRGTS